MAHQHLLGAWELRQHLLMQAVLPRGSVRAGEILGLAVDGCTRRGGGTVVGLGRAEGAASGGAVRYTRELPTRYLYERG